MQIYSRLDGEVRIETEKVVPKERPVAREGWRSGESKSPDGLIFRGEVRERELIGGKIRIGGDEGLGDCGAIC